MCYFSQYYVDHLSSAISLFLNKEFCLYLLWSIFFPYSITAESFINIMRLKEITAKRRSFDCQTNSPGQYKRNCLEESVQNTDVENVKTIKKLTHWFNLFSAHNYTVIVNLFLLNPDKTETYFIQANAQYLQN